MNRVKSATGLNDDGIALLDGLSLRGDREAVLEKIINKAESDGYPILGENGEPYLHITVTAKNEQKASVLAENIQGDLHAAGIDGAAVDFAGEDDKKQAEALGISPGKFKLAEKLVQVDERVSLAEAAGMTVKDISKAIQANEAERLDKEKEAEKQAKQEAHESSMAAKEAEKQAAA
ncbi:hypothetical protein LJC63_10740, partial [Ruminococcaceae bacterium OttesenSCG-928-L11]|nr:hypothetical protein [Ruminococcaceae bacterium OttesenSCG-928-L11]